KIASFDLGNLPFISKIAQKNIPVVMSTGGGNIEDVKASVAILKESVSDISVLHCVSEYPCPANRLGLATIQDYITEFPECRIGSSDHFNGILSGPVAYMLGARIFEKHVTLNRAQKGTDHSFALEPHGFSNFVRDIHRVPEMMPTKNDGSLGKEAVFQKLGKSIVASKNLNKGDKIQMDDLSGRIFSEQHVPVRESKNFIGAVLQNSIQQGELINYEDLQN
ncbi:N-acetylneuraminate synthase family protein, partial [Gammaproteobacteria bacterium]|nr:N-acetylneuraminate synthase family protein [Gammaproteobacteria bacterium]